MAIINDDEDSWREFRKFRNTYNNMVKSKKFNFYKKKLDIRNLDDNSENSSTSSSKRMWNTIKSLSGKLSIQPPRKMVNEGNVVTSVTKFQI